MRARGLREPVDDRVCVDCICIYHDSLGRWLILSSPRDKPRSAMKVMKIHKDCSQRCAVYLRLYALAEAGYLQLNCLRAASSYVGGEHGWMGSCRRIQHERISKSLRYVSVCVLVQYKLLKLRCIVLVRLRDTHRQPSKECYALLQLSLGAEPFPLYLSSYTNNCGDLITGGNARYSRTDAFGAQFQRSYPCKM